MKKIIAGIVAGMILSVAPMVMAAPVEVSGDIAAKYQVDTVEGNPNTNGSVYTLRLLGKAELGDNWWLYARLGAQHATSPLLADFNTDSRVYGANKKTVAAIDQFGLLHEVDKLQFKLGRQDAAVGTTALLYSRAETNIGKKAFVDGLTVSGVVGASEIAVLAAREDNAAGDYNNKVYAVHAGHSPTENLTWGLTLGRFQGETENTNHWAVDGTYKFGKNSLIAEYTQASSNTNNKAYAITWNCDFNEKLSAAITGFRVEESGSMGGQSDFDADNHGFHYGLSYKLTDVSGIDVVYKNQKNISGGHKNSKFEATLSRTF